MFSINKTKNSDGSLDSEIPISDSMVDNNKSISGIELRDIDIERIDSDSSRDNPRLGVNEVKEELKNAISSRLGRDLVLEVSQRPGDYNYCLHRGGNTRLEILRELHSEWDLAHGDNPYRTVVCMVFPWAGESEKSIISATENIVRGNFSFAEQSRAVVILSERYEELGIANDGVEFIDWAKSLGMSMSMQKDCLTRYTHTNKYITPYMPILMVENRANQTAVRYLIGLRRSLYNLLKNRDSDASNPRSVEDHIRETASNNTDIISGRVFAECDGDKLDKELLCKKIVEAIEDVTGLISDQERGVFIEEDRRDIEEFGARYGINGDLSVTNDDKRNAAVLLVDALSSESNLTAHMRTRTMKRLNITNDVGGFIKLASHLDNGGKKMLARMVKEA